MLQHVPHPIQAHMDNVARMSPLKQSIELLNKQLQQVENGLPSLESRITPILAPIEKNTDPPPGVDRPAICPEAPCELRERIESMERWVARMVSGLNGIQERLEI